MMHAGTAARTGARRSNTSQRKTATVTTNRCTARFGLTPEICALSPQSSCISAMLDGCAPSRRRRDWKAPARTCWAACGSCRRADGTGALSWRRLRRATGALPAACAQRARDKRERVADCVSEASGKLLVDVSACWTCSAVLDTHRLSQPRKGRGQCEAQDAAHCKQRCQLRRLRTPEGE